MALIEKLTAIADAIRMKTGETEALTLDEMATMIDSIQSGGGSVNLDAVGITAIDSGKITPASNNTSLSMTHGLGKTPKILIIYTDDYNSCLHYDAVCIALVFSIIHGSGTDTTTYTSRLITGKGNASWGEKLGSVTSGMVKGKHETNVSTDNTSGIKSATDSEVVLQYNNGANKSSMFLAGVEYKWIFAA